MASIIRTANTLLGGITMENGDLTTLKHVGLLVAAGFAVMLVLILAAHLITG
ncbi:MAG: hypothetical protein ACWA5K_08750 [bacterium]